jgi:hypothetical protein
MEDEVAQRTRGISENILAKQSRARAADTFTRAFVPRFLRGNPPNAWQIARVLEDHNFSEEVIRPIYYWITARAEPLLYDFATEDLFQRSQTSNRSVRIEETVAWINNRLARHRQAWSTTVTLKVARGLLAALRDFGILTGATHKHMAPVYLPLESFAYMALQMTLEGVSGERLIHHNDWRLFLLSSEVVEQLFLRAHQNRFLSYEAAGKLIRVEFQARSLEELADAIARRTS